MQIISPFKDYYDYVQHVYGGGDPKIIYNRKRLGRFENFGTVSLTRGLSITLASELSLPVPCRLKGHSRGWDNGFKWLVVCGKAYPLLNVYTGDAYLLDGQWEVFNAEKHASFIAKPIWCDDTRNKKEKQEKPVTENKENPALVELSKRIGHPVFIINGVNHFNNTVDIAGDCPVLENLGLASYYKPEQLYQDLAYFLVNRMQDSPDLAPPSVMTDNEKIVQHGFDTKQSFRHRK